MHVNRTGAGDGRTYRLAIISASSGWLVPFPKNPRQSLTAEPESDKSDRLPLKILSPPDINMLTERSYDEEVKFSV